jgi:hypothetical protein
MKVLESAFMLKIEEPFRAKINLTVYQKSDVYVSLSCILHSADVHRSRIYLPICPILLLKDEMNI